MNTVIYGRSAVPNENWLAEQETVCREYAAEHGPTITGSYYDIGRTGDGLASVLDVAQQKSVSEVIVTDLARLGRQVDDHIATHQQLHDAGVTIHVAKERTPDGKSAALVGIFQADAAAHEQLDDPLTDEYPGG